MDDDGAIHVDRDITTLNYESGLSWMTDGAIHVDRDITTLWVTDWAYDGWLRDRAINVDTWLLSEVCVKLIMDDCEIGQ